MVRRRPDLLLIIFGRNRFLKPINTERLHLPRQPDRFRRVVGVVRIHHQTEVRSDRFADHLDVAQVRLQPIAHFALHASETGLFIAAGFSC